MLDGLTEDAELLVVDLGGVGNEELAPRLRTGPDAAQGAAPVLTGPLRTGAPEQPPTSFQLKPPPTCWWEALGSQRGFSKDLVALTEPNTAQLIRSGLQDLGWGC